MGCSNSSQNGVKKPKSIDDNNTKKNRYGKPPKDYAADPKFQAFLASGAKGNPKTAKKMYIHQESIPMALEIVGIATKGDGSGKEELAIMDENFKGHVQFKNFCKYVKNHKKGKPCKEPDSSASTSEIFDDVMREYWNEMDPDRTCKISIEVAMDKLK